MKTLSERDHAVIWHPLTQHQMTDLPLSIARGEGAHLIDHAGKHYLDLVSSWWVNIHGHAHPDIAEAIYEQAKTLEHVIFAGFTHEPAVLLAEELLTLLPGSFSKIFYSDNGSTSVEVAVKMAYQFWRNQNESQRTRFIVFENGYHGDTFGAMSVGKGCGWFHHFEELLFKVEIFPYPGTWNHDATVLQKEQQVLEKIAAYLEKWGNETAALIIEPLIQGSGGMNMCRPQFLQKLAELIKSHDILLIYDEVLTGFGRTGDMFACRKSETLPDIICLAKGLTGGFLPLSVTACHERIYQAFLSDNIAQALVHGHSFSANPLGCAASLASLKLLRSAKTQAKIRSIEKVHCEELISLANNTSLEKFRYCGTISAFNVKLTPEYGSAMSIQLREYFLKRGLLIRPLGNVVYLMPPYCVNEEELRRAYKIIQEIMQGVTA